MTPLAARSTLVLGLFSCGAPASTSSVVVTPTPSAGATPAASGAAPQDDKTMVVHVGDTTIRYVTGSAESTGAVMKGLRRAHSAAVACYDSGVARNRGLRGRIVVEMLLTSSGTVRSVTDGGSSLPDREVVDCILGAFHKASFADLDGTCTGDVAVSDSLAFEPRTGP